MIEEWLVSNLWWIVIIAAVVIGLKVWLGFVLKRAKIAIQQHKEQTKNQVKGSEDIEMWVNHPEEAIQALMTKRSVLEKEKRTSEIESVDQQIKWLGYMTKIPPVIRPFSSKIINIGLNKAEKIIGGL